MIRKVRIENYKSIPDLTLDLGRVNVLIGANGSGKSNILEAIALASAAAQFKLDNEFLTSRGIRMTEFQFLRSAFHQNSQSQIIKISLERENGDPSEYEIKEDPNPSFRQLRSFFSVVYTDIQKYQERQNIAAGTPVTEFLNTKVLFEIAREKAGTLFGFVVFAPENTSLRTFQSEGQILPLGIKGEGLFAHLKALNSETYRNRLLKIKKRLTLIDWFETFEIPDDLSPGERSIRIRDRFLPESALFDQRSANEGFLFLLFYITLFISPDTPAFFSIDNIDNSLNPKLCIALLQQLVILAKEHDKQVILTTHNPAILDGLNLHDDEQRLLVVDRSKEGHTRVRRVDPPKASEGQQPVRLSEAFVRGYIGGLPKNF